VTIPADETSAAFTINTTAVATATPVSVYATYRTRVTADITVNPSPARLASLTLNPPSVNAGTSSMATVTLTSGAPAGGAWISLSSDQPAIATPPSPVIVPQGETSATFMVTTFQCRPGSAKISATYAGTAAEASLTATTTPDRVAIQRARYQARRRILTIEATSTDQNATLDAYAWSDGEVGSYIGRLTRRPGGSYQGQLPWPVWPHEIMVASSSCGWATSTVTDPPHK
jgi:hypothetical protein